MRNTYVDRTDEARRFGTAKDVRVFVCPRGLGEYWKCTVFRSPTIDQRDGVNDTRSGRGIGHVHES